MKKFGNCGSYNDEEEYAAGVIQWGWKVYRMKKLKKNEKKGSLCIKVNMAPQEKYNQICEQIRCLEQSNETKYEHKLKKINKLLDNEYRYGSSKYDLKRLFKYIDDCLKK